MIYFSFPYMYIHRVDWWHYTLVESAQPAYKSWATLHKTEMGGSR